uniref:Ig-like domain-containing protein n=1 Tax=Myripristis murdjan TaxID=586833 RepID=A0A667YKY8_9TELE
MGLKCSLAISLAVVHTGLTDGSDVTQTPKLWNNVGENATIDCSHTKDSTYNQMYWYRQLPGEGMKQIVFTSTYVTVQMGGGANKGDTSTLTIEELSLNSSAVYFCAASYHSAAYRCSSVQKPPITHFSISVLQLTAPCTWINPF